MGDSEDDLREAVEGVFESETEDAILNWNGVSVAISYKYDMSVMIDGLMDALITMRSASVGELVVEWPSNTFQATWQLAWNEQEFVCTATWDSVSGGVERLLSAAGAVRISRDDFLAEWKAPLERVVSMLRRAGYSPSGLPRLGALEQLLTQLPKPGRLYRR